MALVDEGLSFLCLCLNAVCIFILPVCQQKPLSVFIHMYVCTCLQQAADSYVDKIVSAVVSEPCFCQS